MKNIKLMYGIGFLGNLFFERGIWILYLNYIGLGLGQIGILQSVLNLSMFLFEVPSGILSDKIGKKNTLRLGHTFIFFYLIIFAFTMDYGWLFFGHILYGIGLTLISGTDQALLYDTHERFKKTNLYTRSIGFYNMFILLAISISTYLGVVLKI